MIKKKVIMLEGMNSENLPLTLTPPRRSVDLSPVSIYAGREHLRKLTITGIIAMGSRTVRNPVVKLAFTQAGIGERHRRTVGSESSVQGKPVLQVSRP
jgi:hypothetical protein